MSWVQVCPVDVVNGSCPEPLVWHDIGAVLPLTFDQFYAMLPELIGILVTAYGVKLIVRLMLNHRG